MARIVSPSIVAPAVLQEVAAPVVSGSQGASYPMKHISLKFEASNYVDTGGLTGELGAKDQPAMAVASIGDLMYSLSRCECI